MAQTLFQTVGSGSSGGGGTTLRWYLPDSGGPFKGLTVSFLEYYAFSQEATQVIFAMFVIPASYVTGTQIFLKNGKAFSATNSGNFLFRATSQIFKANIDSRSSPTANTSTNTQQAVDATGYEIVNISDIQLTSASGQINSVAVAIGDTILVKLYRDTATETSGVADDMNLLIDSFELVLS